MYKCVITELSPVIKLLVAQLKAGSLVELQVSSDTVDQIGQARADAQHGA